MKIKEGDYVRVIPRECTPADAKNGLFYGYFGGLCGTVVRIYEGDEVCLNVDLETLPPDILKRHIEIQESIKRKWLNGLSNEARNHLTSEEKHFELSYTILVSASDIEKIKDVKKNASTEPRPIAIKSSKQLNPPVTESKAQVEPSETAIAEKPTKKSSTKTEAKSSGSTIKTSSKVKSTEQNDNNDLTPAELEFLKQRERALKKKK